MRAVGVGVLGILVLIAGALIAAPRESAAEDDPPAVRNLKVQVHELMEEMRKQSVQIVEWKEKFETEQRSHTKSVMQLQTQLADSNELGNRKAVKLVETEMRLAITVAAQHAAEVDNATLRARLNIVRQFEEKFLHAHKVLASQAKTDLANAQKVYEELTASWKKRNEIAEDRIDVLEKGLAPSHEALRKSEEARRQDVHQLQQQLSEALERGNRNAINTLRRSDPMILVMRERMQSMQEWIAGIIARVGRPVLPGLLDDLEADPEEYGAWIIPALARMGPMAKEALPVLQHIVDDPATKSSGLAAKAQKALEAIRKK